MTMSEPSGAVPECEREDVLRLYGGQIERFLAEREEIDRVYRKVRQHLDPEEQDVLLACCECYREEIVTRLRDLFARRDALLPPPGGYED
jgi:hypothetical protein